MDWGRTHLLLYTATMAVTPRLATVKELDGPSAEPTHARAVSTAGMGSGDGESWERTSIGHRQGVTLSGASNAHSAAQVTVMVTLGAALPSPDGML